MKYIIIGIAVFLLAGIGVYLVQQMEFDPDSPSDADTSTTTDGGTEPNLSATTTETFTSEVVNGWRFSLDYPERVTASRIQDSIYEFKFVGPGSEPNTEITDGFYVSMRFATDTTLGAYVNAQDVVGEPATTTFKNHTALRYQVLTIVGPDTAQHLAVRLEEDGPILDISQQVYSDTAGTYAETISDMIESLQFEQVGNPSVPDDVAAEIEAKADLIKITDPVPGTTVGNPIEVSGEARGSWYFEASFPVVVTDWDGRIVGEGFVTAEEEWMTTEFVPFSGTVSYTITDPLVYDRGSLILQKANPSGLPQNDDALEIPIRLSQ